MSDNSEVVITIRVPVGVSVKTEPPPRGSDRDVSITMRCPDDTDLSLPSGDLAADGVVSPRKSTVTGVAAELDTLGKPTGTTIPGTNVQNNNGAWSMTFAGLKPNTSYRITVSSSDGATHSVTVRTGARVKGEKG
jgi:hypothetical protein